MTTKDLRNNVEKVLGNSIRCLLPSYWWKRLFNQVADTIDTINGVEIVESEAKLKNLDVQQGSLASVATRKEMKISECYFLTEEDESLTEAELFAKLTPVKAIKVNFPLPDLSSADTVLQLVSEDKKYLGHLMLGKGLCAALFTDVAAGTQKIWMLISQHFVDEVNNYLKEKKFYILDDRETTGEEDMALLDSVFTIVDFNTDVYVKGMSWERLAKEGEGGTSTPTESVKYELYVPFLTTLPNSYKEKNKAVVEEVFALNSAFTPSQFHIYTYDNGKDAGVFNVESVSVPLSTGEKKLTVTANSMYRNDSRLPNLVNFVFSEDGSCTSMTVEYTDKQVVYATLPESNKTISDDEKVHNAKVYSSLNAHLRDDAEGVYGLPLVYFLVKGIAPMMATFISRTYTAWQGQMTYVLVFSSPMGTGHFSVALYPDGSFTASMGAWEAEVVTDTALSTTSENPLQNKVVTAELAKKQDKLVSGTSIKTINGTTLLGSGDIKVAADVTIDSYLSSSSTNPVQNKVVYNALQGKASTSSVTSLDNAKADKSDIKTVNGVSLLGGGNLQLGDGQTIVYDDSAVMERVAELEYNWEYHNDVIVTELYDYIDEIYAELEDMTYDIETALDMWDYIMGLEDRIKELESKQS